MSQERRAFPIVELFGFPYDTASAEAQDCRAAYRCPFLDSRCIKGGHDIPIPLGACTVTSSYGPVITCPIRLYEDDYKVLNQVGSFLFGSMDQVVRIPEVGPSLTHSIDWILAKYDDDLQMQNYHGVEVQTIDITGSVRPYFEAILAGADWQHVTHRHGINWANVFKRALPQILAKGAMLASYGKKLAVVVQDQLLDYIKRSGRMVIEEERNRDLANLLFFSYRLSHDEAQNVYHLELDGVLPTSLRRLETAFIAGLLGEQIPLRDEFERIVQRRLLELLDVQ